ncbi:MAG TPA: ABC transporter substrate-binding protein [Kiritimatiellia bacterium]|nr:ABC transporter substrate-binding protein [Kiritimatiellia bacterium]
MNRNLGILAAAALVIALPFLFRGERATSAWRPGDPVLIIVTPHNEAIRYEFAEAFSAWHHEHYGQPVLIDWRAIGGTTEIARYLRSEYINAMRAWWTGQGRPWTALAGETMTDRRFQPDREPRPEPREGESETAFARRSEQELAHWRQLRDIYLAFRSTDDPRSFSSRIDLFFGGGEYDHRIANQQGLTVPPWPDAPPPGIFETPDGATLIPAEISGEVWFTSTLFGNAVSTFGICYNFDRLRDLGIHTPPSEWEHLSDPRYVRQLGVADPTKSGSIAKAFELIIHEQCHKQVAEAGFTRDDILRFEASIAAARLPDGQLPDDVPRAYQDAIEAGWLRGLRLVQRIGANARYFTDSASKVPIDVSTGNAAAGIAIDFFGRYQAQASLRPDGSPTMAYVTPTGGSGVSCDPISLLRGAPSRDIAVRFIEFTLTEPGQRLWTYHAGTPGGPRKYTLRRIPIRRDFYPSDHPDLHAAHLRHLQHSADDLADPRINPYALAEEFLYVSRWTGRHFGIHRDLIRCMSMNSARELRAVWLAILQNGGLENQPEALRLLSRMPDLPEELTWLNALSLSRRIDRLDYTREWTLFFRQSYREALQAVQPLQPTTTRNPREKNLLECGGLTPLWAAQAAHLTNNILKATLAETKNSGGKPPHSKTLIDSPIPFSIPQLEGPAPARPAPAPENPPHA